jgi:hypothetical protein
VVASTRQTSIAGKNVFLITSEKTILISPDPYIGNMSNEVKVKWDPTSSLSCNHCQMQQQSQNQQNGPVV